MNGSTGISTSALEGPEQDSVMHGFADRQADFARAILDPHRLAPSGSDRPRRTTEREALRRHRNNVVVGLIETLKAAYPVVHRLVGEEFFTAMRAACYVMAEPPASPIMLDYGAGFPAFIARFEPASVLPIFRMSRLERAWVEAYHAAGVAPLPPSALGQVPPDDVPALRLTCIPPSALSVPDFPIVGIWQANTDGNDFRSVDLGEGGDDALIVHVPRRRSRFGVCRRAPPHSSRHCGAGAPIVDAVMEGLSISPRFDLADALRGADRGKHNRRPRHAAGSIDGGVA